MELVDGRILQVKKQLGTNHGVNRVIKEIARTFNITPLYLQQLFKKETGKTIFQYDRDLKLEAAKHLLITTHMSAKVICYKVGFKEYTHFLRNFKKKYRMSPKEMRRKSWMNEEKGI